MVMITLNFLVVTPSREGKGADEMRSISSQARGCYKALRKATFWFIASNPHKHTPY